MFDELTRWEKIYYPIYRFFKYTLWCNIRNFPRSFVNGLHWFTLGYQDRQWDHHYFYEVLLFKLKKMEKFWGNRDKVMVIEKDRLKNYNNIKKCRKLIEKLMSNEFDIDAPEYKAHDKKWGELRMKLVDCGHEEYSEIKTYRTKKLTENQKEFETKAFLRMTKDLRRQQARAVERLFSIIAKEVEYWWD